MTSPDPVADEPPAVELQGFTYVFTRIGGTWVEFIRHDGKRWRPLAYGEETSRIHAVIDGKVYVPFE